MDKAMPKPEHSKRSSAMVLAINPTAPMVEEEAPALEVEQIWKVFGSDKQQFNTLDMDQRTPEEFAKRSWVPAVRNATFSVQKGEVFVIMGLSGSGKSTLVRCLTRL
ncbi:MAG: ATP-binding cassette domain-containing protein, partial [Notoacmeibacter sp.]